MTRLRGVAIPRSDRLAQGLPVCWGALDCSRAPWRRGLCRVHLAEIPARRSTMGVCSVVALRLPSDLWALARTRAAQESTTAAEWIRRAVAEKLGQTSDNVSGGPRT